MWWVGLGVSGPVLVAAVLVSLRDVMLNANVALVLVAVVVTVAVGGGREAGVVAAVISALSFDFFHTEPYLRFRIASGDDMETTLLLLLVGLVVGHVAARGRRAHDAVESSGGEIRRIYRLANLGARGDEPADVIMVAQSELVSLLRLVDCRFEAPPFATSLARLERGGTVYWPAYRLRPGGFELPAAGAELPVLARGQVLGRFVLHPTPGTGVSLEQRVVAVALADQVGAVLAAPQRGEKQSHG